MFIGHIGQFWTWRLQSSSFFSKWLYKPCKCTCACASTLSCSRFSWLWAWSVTCERGETTICFIVTTTLTKKYCSTKRKLDWRKKSCSSSWRRYLKCLVAFCSVILSESDTSFRWNNRSVVPVIERRIQEPGCESAYWETPTSNVFHSVSGSLGSQFPESGQIHLFYLIIIISESQTITIEF